MNAITESARRLLRREGTDITEQVDGLERAVKAARGRLDDSVLEEAEEVVDRATARLRLSSEHTIVALAGATGSGKSSLFNTLTDLELASVGVRRPTTSWALACAWGPAGASEILEWMGIPARHQVSRTSMLDSSADDTNLQGLVLVDLPDHDSTEVSHHLEVDRLVGYADLLVWVLDPQKYADAAVHDRYLKPLASHADVTLVILNQIDRVPEDHREATLADVRRLLDEDGMQGATLLATSAATGEGIDDLKRQLVKRIRDKQSATDRLSGDIVPVAQQLIEISGITEPPPLTEADRTELDDSLAESAGVPIVVEAIESSTSRRARLATGWPVTRWLGKLRSDPLRRLEIETDISISQLARSSVPEPTKVQRARAVAAMRAMADTASAGLKPPWVRTIKQAATSRSSDLGDALDQAVLSTDLGVARPAWWWRVVNVLQWLLFVAALTGIVWLGVLAVFGYLRIDGPEGPDVEGFPLPTVLAVGGVVAGIAVALLCRMLARRSGRRKARRAEHKLRKSIHSVAQQLVVEPIEAERAAYEETRTGLKSAARVH